MHIEQLTNYHVLAGPRCSCVEYLWLAARCWKTDIYWLECWADDRTGAEWRSLSTCRTRWMLADRAAWQAGCVHTQHASDYNNDTYNKSRQREKVYLNRLTGRRRARCCSTEITQETRDWATFPLCTALHWRWELLSHWDRALWVGDNLYIAREHLYTQTS